MEETNLREITIQVDAEAARAYAAAHRRSGVTIDLLLGRRLGEVTGPLAPLERVMREIGAKARARGLTKEQLDELLRK